MKTNHRHSTVSILLCAFVTFTFIGRGVSSLAQTKDRRYGEKTAFIVSKIDAAAAKEFQKAWHVSRNGSDGFEGLVLVYATPDGSISARSQGKSDEPRQFTFGWRANIIAVVHTHPNGVDPKPVGHDLRLADIGVPVFTITQRGMYVYDPATKKISLVQEGLDWLESSRWKQDSATSSAKVVSASAGWHR
ncbi:MAG: hypothetical protein DMF60_03205 [Acidobacteria bacterium]|nr:MAG: hypothetical protein DMF60_03205 [Acidobacteriota bacterium]